MGLKTSQTTGRAGSSMGSAYEEGQRAQAQAQPSASSQADEQGASPFNIRQLQSMMTLPAAANTQSEVLSRMRGVLEKDIKDIPDAVFDINLVGMDRDNPALNLGVSVLVVTVQIKSHKTIGMGYHTLLLAASTPDLDPVDYPIGNGQTVQVRRVVGDAYDDIMRNEVHKELARQFPGTPLFSSDARTIPSVFDLNDQGLVKQLRGEIVVAASVALLRTLPNFTDVNLLHMEVDSTLSLHTSFGNPQLMDSVGQPIRGDVRVQFKAGVSKTQQGGVQSPNMEKPAEITSITGYPDLIHIPQPAANPYAPVAQQQWQGNQPPSVAQYLARFVITQLKSTAASTLAQQLLSLGMIYTLRRPGAWYPHFKPQYAREPAKETDLKDIGVLTIELGKDPVTGQPGQKTNTKIDTFSPASLGVLLNTAVQPGLIISMDVSECGSDTAANAPFAAAAAGDVDATNTLWDAANYLTNGNFAEFYPKGQPICFTENDRIMNGYYSGRGGERRDIRDLDYVAMMNLLGESSLKIVHDWSATHTRSEFPIEQRLDARFRIIDELLVDFKLTGYSLRITFVDAFLQALTKAIAATKLSVREFSPFNDTQSYDQPTYRFADIALGGYTQTPMSQGYSQGGQGTQYAHAGRWG